MTHDFHPDAKQELSDAVAYYDNVSRELSDAFIEEVEQTLNRIELLLGNDTVVMIVLEYNIVLISRSDMCIL